MKKYLIIIQHIFCITCFLFLYSSFSFSQSISKSRFHDLFEQGNRMILEHFYDTAARTFLILHKADPSNANINYKIGCCYLRLPAKKFKAVAYLENAVKQTKGDYREDDAGEKNAPEDAIYYLGQAYHYTYKFDKAIAQFKQFRELVGKWNLNLVKEIDHWIETSNSAKELVSKPVECVITNLGDSINSKYPDYSPVISADESVMIFTSRREGTGGPNNKTLDDEFFEDILISYRGPYGTWTKAKGISRTINTPGHEATIGLSADGEQLYIYRDDGGDGNIYLSKLDGEYWEEPIKLDANKINSPDWEPSACISADGNTLYFVSNRKGGLGGRDIYQCHRLLNGNWGEPENLGPAINTPYDEDAPFIHPDGITLFFSSTGHKSMGGFDVFYSTKVANNMWTEPTNMGFPINTVDDDIYFVTSSDGRRAYYSSLRPEGKGEKDIYMVTLPKPFVKSIAVLVGYLKNRDGSHIPQNSLVTIKSEKGSTVFSKPNEASGKFIQPLLPKQIYEINIEVNGNNIFTDKFFLPEDSSYQNLSRGFFQRTIYIGDTARIFSARQLIDTINQSKDTTSKIVLAPIEGKILINGSPRQPAPSVFAQLLNNQGNIVASAITDSSGSFKFQNIPSNQNYSIKINENDTILKTQNKFLLTDNNNNVISPSSQENSFFIFKNLPSDITKLNPIEAKDTIPLVTMKGRIVTEDKKGKANITVNLMDEERKILQTKITDKAGNFSFENLAQDKNYTIALKADDPALKNISSLYIANSRDEIIKKLSKIADYFIYERLPADLNKLTPIDVKDTAKLATMKGKLLKSNNPKDGLANADILLMNENNDTLQSSKTNQAGVFKFEKISSDKNYTIKLKENNPALQSLQKLYLSTATNKIVSMIEVNKKETEFRQLPANLMQMAEMKNTSVTASDNKPSIISYDIKNHGDDKFDFVIYFSYNKKEINTSVESFLALIEKVNKNINDKGNAAISIIASSSTVPTKSYPDNESLAKARAEEIKDKVRASLSFKNLDGSKISYDISAKVQGPGYKNDAVQNRKEYEKWQYVKVTVK